MSEGSKDNFKTERLKSVDGKTLILSVLCVHHIKDCLHLGSRVIGVT